MKKIWFLFSVCLMRFSFAQQLVPECGALYNYQRNFVDIVYPGVKLSDVTVTSDSAEVTRYDDTTCVVTPKIKGKMLTLFIKLKSKGKAVPVQVAVKITKKPVVEFSAGGAVAGKDNYFELKAKEIKFYDYPPTIHILLKTDCKVGAYQSYTEQPISFDVTVNGKNFSCKSTYSDEALAEIRKFKSGKINYTNIITTWSNNSFKIAKVEVVVK